MLQGRREAQRSNTWTIGHGDRPRRNACLFEENVGLATLAPGVGGLVVPRHADWHLNEDGKSNLVDN